MDRLRLFAGFLTGALLVGCAGTPTSETDEARVANSKLDVEKMHRVEQEARMSGLDVIWINPPTKKEDDQ